MRKARETPQRRAAAQGAGGDRGEGGDRGAAGAHPRAHLRADAPPARGAGAAGVGRRAAGRAKGLFVRWQVGGGGGQPGVDGGNAAAEGGAGLPGPRPRPTAERELEPREGVRRGATTSRAWQTVLQ